MEEHQSTNESSEMPSYEDMLDDDESRLIIDEESLSSEKNNEKLSKDSVPSTHGLKPKKNIQETGNTYPCPDCGRKFRRKVKLQAHLLVHKSKDGLECENCGKKYRKVNALFNHVCSALDHNYKCSDCDECFRLKKELQAHQQQQHKKSLPLEEPINHQEEEDRKPLLPEEPESCKEQDRKISLLPEEPISHQEEDDKKSIPLIQPVSDQEQYRKKSHPLDEPISHLEEDCKKTSTSDEPTNDGDQFEELDFSTFVASFVKWPITCTQCGSELNDLKSYTRHIAAHKEGEPCVCSVCKMKFSCKDDYALHKDLCHIEGIFECTCCNKRFHTEKKLNKHLEVHTGGGLFCHICGTNFVTEDKLIQHVATHKASVFVCAKCKKIFKGNDAFKNHSCTPESSENKHYKFADASERKMKEHYFYSLSANEESDSEDADAPRVDEPRSCQVCGESFEHKEAFLLHLATHFQCMDCKKYFKNQTDLDMHTFLLADERLLSCCICESIVHGKKELELHLSNHLASDDVSLDDLDWEDNAEAFHNVISSLDSAESLHSALPGRSITDVRIHRVILSGSNGLMCSSCGKLVSQHHNHAANVELNMAAADSDEEYVFISRLGKQQKSRQAEETHCTCNLSFDVLLSLSELTPKKPISEDESKDVKKTSNSQTQTYLNPLKHTIKGSVDSISKPVSSKNTEETSVGQVNLSDDKGSNSDKHNDLENVKYDPSTSFKLVNVNNLLNKEIVSDSPSVSKVAGKKNAKKRSHSSKSFLNNGKLNGKKEAKKSGIKVIKLDNKNETLPITATTKEYVVNSNKGNENGGAKPVKILVSTGLFTFPTNGSDVKSAYTEKNSVTKKSCSEFNVLSKEHLAFPLPVGRGSMKSLQDRVLSTQKKIKQEESLKKPLPSKLKTDRVEVVAAMTNGNNWTISHHNKSNSKSNSARGKGEKRKRVTNTLSSMKTKKTERKYARKTPGLAKIDSLMSRTNKEKLILPKVSQLTRREEEKVQVIPNASTPNPNSIGSNSETCFIPESNMVFKVERLDYESDEVDEEDSLDFSGIKKEFLASDVFIKEEEWDIVDF